jgi:hypothetical protein
VLANRRLLDAINRVTVALILMRSQKILNDGSIHDMFGNGGKVCSMIPHIRWRSWQLKDIMHAVEPLFAIVAYDESLLGSDGRC